MSSGQQCPQVKYQINYVILVQQTFGLGYGQHRVIGETVGPFVPFWEKVDDIFSSV